MSLMKFWNCKFCSLKLCIEYKLINYIVNNIQLTQNLICVLECKKHAI